MAYSKQQLKAYRVARKLKGQAGAPMVTVQQEFWRYRAWARSAEHAELEAYMHGRQRLRKGFGTGIGYTRYIEVDPKGKIRAYPACGGLSEIVGQVYRDEVVLLRSAPRWLLNWAKWRSDVYVLEGTSLSRRALRAHIARGEATRK